LREGDGRERRDHSNDDPQKKTFHQESFGVTRTLLNLVTLPSSVGRSLAPVAALLCAGVVAACAAGARTNGDANDRYVRAYQRMHPSVVLFTMKIPADDPRRPGQWDDAYGSGVVVESGAWGSRILTDAHVIADAKDLVATIGDGPHAPAHVIATTHDDRDLALIDTAIPNQRVAPLGTSGGLVPGTAVGLLGYPIPDAFEDEKLRRTVSLYTGRIASVRNGALELDMPIVPGESGGPVFDANSGTVIGIAESRFDDERAIGFATPIDEARSFLHAHAR
jgi:S1-C subfamily serine protease